MKDMTLRFTSTTLAGAVLLTSLTACQVPSDSVSDESAEGSESQLQGAGVDKLEVEIVDRHPFDDTSFTQGLEAEDGGTLLVGTGQHGDSRIYRTTVDGRQSDSHDLSEEFFGEGITRDGNTVWQLTWQENTVFERDADTLAEVDRHTYEGEGWGICTRKDELIMSDGTHELRRINPTNFAERERFPVTLDGEAIAGINELECVNGDIYANIFTTTDIVRIDGDTGKVTAVIDASGVPNNGPANNPDSVLNGIAHIPGTDRFYLSGKLWPDLFEVRFVDGR